VALQVSQVGDEEPLLQIRVTDNGKGIAGERVGGRGLMNMRSRANKIAAPWPWRAWPAPAPA